jgi:hypothetical protein
MIQRVIPAEAGIPGQEVAIGPSMHRRLFLAGIPASAGMTV